MNSELMPELARRAAAHAALADPARLRITDTLLAGDASPSELAAMLGMPSNLLAHHLRVLEQAGIIARRRSAGDHRRTYLRLISGPVDSLAAAPRRDAQRVLFVCTANSARSHLAAALWRRASGVPAASAGTHPAAQIDPGAVAAARRHLLPMRLPRPRHISDVQQDGDLVVTVCDQAAKNSAAESRCTGPFPTRSRPVTPAASTRQSPNSADASNASPRAFTSPADQSPGRAPRYPDAAAVPQHRVPVPAFSSASAASQLRLPSPPQNVALSASTV